MIQVSNFNKVNSDFEELYFGINNNNNNSNININ